MDMEQVINTTKNSGVVYENLAHYLFSEMIKAHDTTNDFDFLSPFTWLCIFGWIASGVALALVIYLRIKVRSLSLLLLARTAQAAPTGTGFQLPKILTLTSTTPVTQPAIDIIAEWTKHVGNVSSLLPTEVLILIFIILALLFKLACLIYRARKAETARTRMVLDVGNGFDNVLIQLWIYLIRLSITICTYIYPLSEVGKS